MAVRRSHVSAVAGCAVYLAAVVALMWNGGDTEPSGGLLSALAMIVWLLGSVLVGRQFGVPALWLPILALPVGILTANAWGHNDEEMRVYNWGIIFLVSVVLVSAGVWAWIRRQPNR